MSAKLPEINVVLGKTSEATSNGITSDLQNSGEIQIDNIPDSPTKEPTSANIRQRLNVRRSTSQKGQTSESFGSLEDDIVIVSKAENEIEAQRIANNYLFGFKKWKSHVTSRPLSTRSEIVQDLYSDINKIQPVTVSTVRPSNIIYVILLGWWQALIYIIIGLLMYLTVIGWKYGSLCFKMAKYFFWPFGKFVYLVHPVPVVKQQDGGAAVQLHKSTDETTVLLSMDHTNSPKPKSKCREFWSKPQSYVWLLLGLPVLCIVHAFVVMMSWLLVISIPIAKVNFKMVVYVLFMQPEKVEIGDSSATAMDMNRQYTEIIMYTHRSVYIYYYKYTVDGMNIILVNLLVFVLLSLAIGYSDPENHLTTGTTKCILAVLAFIPLTYYIGMAIISIAVQSSFAVGAVMNATFGSIVELILYVITLKKGLDLNSICYSELVKSSLTGTIIGCLLFIPGIAMIVGGLKFQSQNFNPKSASVTALLLFVAVGGVFAPTLFSKIFGDLQCNKCETSNSTIINGTEVNRTSYGLHCSECTTSVLGLDGDISLYTKHIRPLVYACAVLLPIAYIIGMVFTFKTHSKHLFEEFYAQQEKDGHGIDLDYIDHGMKHGKVQWSRLKSATILLISATLIALCADLITENINDLLNNSGVSYYFVGVTMIAMVPELPEIVNGIQFALQNNVNLGIEIGTSTSIQVCMLQIPILILIDLIYPFKFYAIFSDVHMWSVFFSLIVINYTFQDGKSDYLQGTVLVFIYLLLLCMYFFSPTPDNVTC